MEGLKKAVKVLRNLESDRQAADGLRVQIQQIEADMITLSEMGYMHPQGEKITPDKRMKALIDEKAGLLSREKAKREHVLHVERVLGSLSEQENLVLSERYVKRTRNGDAVMRRLAWEMNVSEETAGRIKRCALREFARRMGYVDDTAEGWYNLEGGRYENDLSRHAEKGSSGRV